MLRSSDNLNRNTVGGEPVILADTSNTAANQAQPRRETGGASFIPRGIALVGRLGSYPGSGRFNSGSRYFPFIPAEGIVPGHRLGNPGSAQGIVPSRARHTEAQTDTSDAAFQIVGLRAGFLPARSYSCLFWARYARRLLDSVTLTAK